MEKSKEGKRQNFVITEKRNAAEQFKEILSVHLGLKPINFSEPEKAMIQLQEMREAKVQGMFTTDGFNTTVLP